MRALSKLTEEVDGERRIVNDPPLIVRASDVFAQDGFSPEEMRERLQGLLSAYRRTLSGELRHLMDGYREVDVARKVVGVGSVGTSAWIVLMVGRDGQDPLFLQVKEAQHSVLEPFAQRSPFKNQGQRVVEGQRLMQAAGDILLGWIRGEGPDGRERDFYVRQLWDAKGSAVVEAMSAAERATCTGSSAGRRWRGRTRARATGSPSRRTSAAASASTTPGRLRRDLRRPERARPRGAGAGHRRGASRGPGRGMTWPWGCSPWTTRTSSGRPRAT